MRHSYCHLLLIAALFSGGCVFGGEEGGLNILARAVPDEFSVVKRRPLTLPPDFSLRPPAETDRRSQVALTDTAQEAKRALLGTSLDTSPDSGTQGASRTFWDPDDLALLKKLGAENTDENIRRVVDQESTDLLHANRQYVRELLSFLFDQEQPGKVLKPQDAERAVRQRLLVDTNSVSEQKVTIERARDDDGFDWDKLWPF